MLAQMMPGGRLLAMLAWLFLGAEAGAAQKAEVHREGPTTIALHLGVWSQERGQEWPRAAISVDHGLGTFIARIEAWAVSRPEVICGDGADFPGCNDRKLIRGVSIGGRLMDRDGDWHPFGGAGLGLTRYYGNGSQFYLEAGTRLDLGRRWGGEAKLGADVLGEGDGIGGGLSLGLGIWYAFR